ncbi:class I SAM-dependent methyltransferase [Hwanghaeella sp.]|uniref:class I SAM-dependent methyltransferase n=1 Tax=Hwanghaeella sp. TaxID=2605943 RepID=UPI003CCBB007
MCADKVRDQYEEFPYPTRDLADERRRLITGSPSHLAEINHYVFGGRLDFTQPFRALIAGGGTGDAAIMLAQHLSDADVPAEIVYLDLSTASRAITEARAKARGLSNISFYTGSLLELGDFGEFDYIDCCGVLHHLPVPQDGFASLARALKPKGGLGLMVYGEFGRTGVYDVQAMLRDLVRDGESGTDKVTLAHKLLTALPPSNRLRRNPLVGDHLSSDAGLYDLLLHSQDRAYTVPDLVDEIETAGLRIASFIEPLRYDPALYLRDKGLLQRLEGQGLAQRAGFAERLAGNMKKHIVYCVRQDNDEETVAGPVGPSAIPVLRDAPGPEFARNMPPGAAFSASLDGLDFSMPLPPLARDILLLCEGRRTLDEIRKALPGAPDWFRFKPQFDAVYKPLNGFNKMLLRFASA